MTRPGVPVRSAQCVDSCYELTLNFHRITREKLYLVFYTDQWFSCVNIRRALLLFIVIDVNDE